MTNISLRHTKSLEPQYIPSVPQLMVVVRGQLEADVRQKKCGISRFWHGQSEIFWLEPGHKIENEIDHELLSTLEGILEPQHSPQLHRPAASFEEMRSLEQDAINLMLSNYREQKRRSIAIAALSKV